MTAVGWLPAPVEELFGTEATAEESYALLTVDVPPTTWLAALRTARDDLGCTYFDWLSAVDEPGTGFRVAAHVVVLSPVRRLLVRTTVPHETPVLPSAVDIYAGAAWHERETHEMFGVDFEGHPGLDHLLLPETFEGHPLRKDFVLAARVAKAWPGAKEPGESDHGAPKRRQMLPPGVPDPNEWGPLKGQLPAAPARPARGAGRAAAERPARPGRETPARAAGDTPARGAGDRPARRTRSASEGSASQGVQLGAVRLRARCRRVTVWCPRVTVWCRRPGRQCRRAPARCRRLGVKCRQLGGQRRRVRARCRRPRGRGRAGIRPRAKARIRPRGRVRVRPRGRVRGSRPRVVTPLR